MHIPTRENPDICVSNTGNSIFSVLWLNSTAQEILQCGRSTGAMTLLCNTQLMRSMCVNLYCVQGEGQFDVSNNNSCQKCDILCHFTTSCEGVKMFMDMGTVLIIGFCVLVVVFLGGFTMITCFTKGRICNSCCENSRCQETVILSPLV